jgi:hypothetical protein
MTLLAICNFETLAKRPKGQCHDFFTRGSYSHLSVSTSTPYSYSYVLYIISYVCIYAKSTTTHGLYFFEVYTILTTTGMMYNVQPSFELNPNTSYCIIVVLIIKEHYYGFRCSECRERRAPSGKQTFRSQSVRSYVGGASSYLTEDSEDIAAARHSVVGGPKASLQICIRDQSPLCPFRITRPKSNGTVTAAHPGCDIEHSLQGK